MTDVSKSSASSRSRSVEQRWLAIDRQTASLAGGTEEPKRETQSHRVSIFGGSTILEDTLLREMISSRLSTAP